MHRTLLLQLDQTTTYEEDKITLYLRRQARARERGDKDFMTIQMA